MAINGVAGVKVPSMKLSTRSMEPQPSRPIPVDNGVRPASNPKSEKPFARTTPAASSNPIFGAAHNGRG